MDTWQFFQNDRAQWCWKHVSENGFTVDSEVCFESRTDCIADAMRHGYLARPASAARQLRAAPLLAGHALKDPQQ